MHAKILLFLALTNLSLGCKSDGEPAKGEPPAEGDATDPAAAPAESTAKAAAPKPTAGAMKTVAPKGLDQADAEVVKWLRSAAECDLGLTSPETDQPLYEQTWGNRWSWDECPARKTLLDLEAEPEVIDAALLAALADPDAKARLIAVHNLNGGFAKDGKVDALGMLLHAAAAETDPHVGAQLGLLIDSELGDLERLDPSPNAEPFVLALSDALATTSNQGLVAEVSLRCKLPGCEELWPRAARDNPSPTVRALAYDHALSTLDEPKRCDLGLEILADEKDPLVIQYASEGVGSCDAAKATPILVERLEALTVEGPGGAYLWNALDSVGSDDPKLTAKMKAWAKTIVDEQLGNEDIRKNAGYVLEG